MTVSPQRPPVPLLLVCALRIERRALHSGGPRHALETVRVLRTGMGPRAAARAVATAVSDDGAPVLVTGFCAGLAPGLRPGDIVVASEVRGSGAASASTEPSPVLVPGATTAVLVDALRALGLTVHTGPLISSGRLVRGRERAALHAEGAIAADMESAATLRAALAAGSRPLAAVRVVVDTPVDELLRPRTLRTGITAFRALRAAAPAFPDWATALAGTATARFPAPTTTPHDDPLSREVS